MNTNTRTNESPRARIEAEVSEPAGTRPLPSMSRSSEADNRSEGGALETLTAQRGKEQCKNAGVTGRRDGRSFSDSAHTLESPQCASGGGRTSPGAPAAQPFNRRLANVVSGDLSVLKKRFDKKWAAEPSSGCWLWHAKTAGGGYGYLKWQKKDVAATRISLALVGVLAPADLLVCHTCDVPSCVNPNHLFVGDAFDNMRDASRKGRLKANPPPRFSKWSSHCPSGHAMTGDNLWAGDGRRYCKACFQARSAAKAARPQ